LIKRSPVLQNLFLKTQYYAILLNYFGSEYTMTLSSRRSKCWVHEWYSKCIMFTPTRDFLLETPWRIIITNPKCQQSFPNLILITNKGVLAKPKQLLSIIICLFKSYFLSNRRSICSSLVLGVLRQACCKHHVQHKW
jgi:hypothetical protein